MVNSPLTPQNLHIQYIYPTMTMKLLSNPEFQLHQLLVQKILTTISSFQPAISHNREFSINQIPLVSVKSKSINVEEGDPIEFEIYSHRNIVHYNHS